MVNNSAKESGHAARENVVLQKSFEFAVRVVKLCKHLSGAQKEYVLSKQLLRAGTSIGANVNEAQAAQSKADFIAKMSIASKEARETQYWLKLLCATGYLAHTDPDVEAVLERSEELVKLLTSIVKTAQSRRT